MSEWASLHDHFYEKSFSQPASPTPSVRVSRQKHKTQEHNGNSSTVNGNAASVVNKKAESPAFKPGLRFYLAFLSMTVLTLMVALDATTISVALAAISNSLHGSAIEAFWAGTSFLLCSTVFQPLIASLSHLFGRKLLIVTSVAFFLVGTVVGATATDFTRLLIGRSLQGVGGGGIIVMNEIIITDLVPLRLRGKYFGLIGGMWALGSVSGPVVGGAFAELDWRWIFYINFPFIGIGGFLIIVFLNMALSKESTLRAKLARIDWIGSIVFIASTTAFLIPLTWGGINYPWSSWHTIVPLILGALGLISFVFYEMYFASEPLIRLSVFANRTTNITYITNMLHGLVLWCILYYAPLYLEGVRAESPVMSGVYIFPMTFTVAPMTVLTGLLVTKTGRYRPFLWFGWIVSTLGVGLLCLINESTSTVQWCFITVVPGIGLGTLFMAQKIAVQSAAPAQDQAFAVAIFSFFRGLGQALGVAIGGVIVQNQLLHKLQAYPELAPYAHQYAADAAGLVQVIKAMPHDSQMREDLRKAYTDSLRVVWMVCCGLVGVAMIMSAWIQHYDLDREQHTEHTFRGGDAKRTGSRDSADSV